MWVWACACMCLCVLDFDYENQQKKTSKPTSTEEKTHSFCDNRIYICTDSRTKYLLFHMKDLWFNFIANPISLLVFLLHILVATHKWFMHTFGILHIRKNKNEIEWGVSDRFFSFEKKASNRSRERRATEELKWEEKYEFRLNSFICSFFLPILQLCVCGRHAIAYLWIAVGIRSQL